MYVKLNSSKRAHQNEESIGAIRLIGFDSENKGIPVQFVTKHTL